MGSLAHSTTNVNTAHSLENQLSPLTAFEMLSYASLFAFQYYMSGSTPLGMDGEAVEQELAWESINNILIHKLKSSQPDQIRLTDQIIAKSLKKHLSPLLFPSEADASECLQNYHLFSRLILAQAKLNSFLSRTAGAYSFSDDVEFKLAGEQFQIITVDHEFKKKWRDDGKKLSQVQGYWFLRAMEEFLESGLVLQTMGRPENHEQNQIAYIKSIAVRMKLREVYGIADKVPMGKGQHVDLFQAVLSLELMKAFYQSDYVLPFRQLIEETGDWLQALTVLAFEGMSSGFHNRFPFTWSTTEDKAKNIIGWTVSDKNPKGSKGV